MEDPPLYFCDKCPKSFNHKIKLAVHKKYRHTTKHSSLDSENDVISFEFYPKDMPLWKFSKADNNKDTQLKIEHRKTLVAFPSKQMSLTEKLMMLASARSRNLETSPNIDCIQSLLEKHDPNSSGSVQNIPGNFTGMQKTGNSKTIQLAKKSPANMRFDCEIKQGEQSQLQQAHTRSTSQLRKRGRDVDAHNEYWPHQKSQWVRDSVILASTETIITDGSNLIANLKGMEQEGVQAMVKSYKCSYCDYTSSNTSNVKTHERVHTGEKPYKCRYCDHRANWTVAISRHERIHTGEKPYECRYCAHKASQAGDITIHERIHTGERPYKCRYCSHRANRANARRTHERIHTGERPYKCGSCDFTTATHSSLVCHLMIHTGEKPHKCPYCDHSAISSSNIKRHEGIHTGEKPYKCRYCDHSAISSSNIKRHERIHTGGRPEKCGSSDFTTKAHFSPHKSLKD